MKYMLGFLIVISFLAWCPWLTADKAINLVDEGAAQVRQEYPNLCALSVHKETIAKIPFGYTEEVSYDCTATDPVFGVVQSTDTVFILFDEKLMSMPVQTVAKSLQQGE